MFRWFRKHGRRPSRHIRPALAVLEDRLAPAVLTVNTLQDDNPTDSLSLREAVNVVNSGSSAGLTAAQLAQINGTVGTSDTIQFAAGLSGTILLTGGEIDITQQVTINGPGAGILAVNGNFASRILFIAASANTVAISGLTFTDGLLAGPTGGAAIANNAPNFTLTGCVFANNTSANNNGGAIEEAGSSSGVQQIINCTFTRNSAAGNGGAIDAAGPNLTITGSTFDGNTSIASGGGSGGGAVSVGSGTLNLVNCTFASNSAANGSGGAINDNFAANVALLNCTVADNSATSGGGVSNVGGGTFTLTNTIVADDTAAQGNDIAGFVTSGGHSLVKDTNPGGGGTYTSGSGDLPPGTDPMLGPLADNGGPTKTMALRHGSLAIGTGPLGSTLPANDQADQRGIARPAGSPSDLGAFQTDANYFVVTNTNDSGAGSLRQAIVDSNATSLYAGGNPNVIQFDIPGSGVQIIFTLMPLPVVTQSTDIEGYSQPGAAANTLAFGDNAVVLIRIDSSMAGGAVDALVLAAANSTVKGLDITGASASGVVVQGANDIVAGNFIGIAPNGSTTDGNLSNGITLFGTASGAIIGDGTTAGRNVISGNGGSGIVVTGSSSVLIQGNYIGTNPTGNAAVGNGGDGVLLNGGANQVSVGGASAGAGNLISGNRGDGVQISGGGTFLNSVQGNQIGTDAGGALSLGNVGNGVALDSGAGFNTIGGATAAARNVISGNAQNGVFLTGLGTDTDVVIGNFVGTDVTGTVAVGNRADGILITNGPQGTYIGTDGGPPNPAEGNVISGNLADGIAVQAANGIVLDGNLIGVNIGGMTALGNGHYGVLLASGSSFSTVGQQDAGGTLIGVGNTIADNVKGVVITGSGSVSNTILGNRIFDNTIQGIDLGDDGVTPPGSGGSGPNDLQSFPVLTSLVGGVLSGTLHGTPSNSYHLELFATPVTEASHQGQFFLGAQDVPTDATGVLNFTFTPGSLPVNLVLTVTATDLRTGDTSEFSYGPPAQVVAVSGTPQNAVVGTPFTKPLVAQVLDAYGEPIPGITVTFTVPASGAGVSGLNTPPPTLGNGQTSASVAANGVAGSYKIVASVPGTAGADFTLTNSPPPAPAPANVGRTTSPTSSQPPFVSVALGPLGEVVEVVTSAGQLIQFDAFGMHPLGIGGVRAVSVACNGDTEVLLVTTQAGALIQYDAAGAHLLRAAGVRDAAVALGPSGEVVAVVTTNNVLTQYDASGVHPLIGGVTTASVAFDPAGLEVLDVTLQNGALVQADTTATQVLAPDGVLSVGMAYAPDATAVLDVIFQNDLLTQFDALGTHIFGKIE